MVLIKKIVKIFLLLVTTIVFSVQMGQAQGPDPFDDDTDDENPIPIDGGLSLLLAAGAAYGAKKVYNLGKEEKEKE